MAVAAMPAVAIGITISRNTVPKPAPSISAASSSDAGTASKKGCIIQMTSGRLKVMNLFRVDATEQNAAGTRLRIGATSLQVPQRLNGEVRTLGFRAEQLRIGAPQPGQVALELRDCETLAVEQLGDRAFCYLRSSLGELVLLTPGAETALPRDLQLSLAPEALHFFDANELALRKESEAEAVAA